MNEQFMISEISDEKIEFYKASNRQRFIKIQKQLDLNNTILLGEYESNQWKLQDYNSLKYATISFDITLKMDQSTKNNIIKSLKSWCLTHLEENYSITLTRSKTHEIINAINLSNNFDLNYLESFEQVFFDKALRNSTLYSKSFALCDFIDYSDLNITEEYISIINKVYYKSIKNRRNVRTISKSSDVLKYSLLMDDYFKNLISEQEYIKYFPIYLWWNLTNIIPMRINEFCIISKDALKKVKDEYVLELPRTKQKNDLTVKLDEILISEEIAIEILKYQELTNDIKQSNTLLNYWATFKPLSTKDYLTKKTNFKDYFTYHDFCSILSDFNNNIVKDKYNFTFLEELNSELSDITQIEVDNNSISRKIRPNDTRHFAFLNLMLQGHHPSEIAQIGGHKSIQSQYAYHRHLEHWVDSDLFNLLLMQHNTTNNLSNTFFLEILLKQKITPMKSLMSEEHLIPLKIGYCVDPSQNCKVNEHYWCEHWRITKEDYEEHSAELFNAIGTQKSIISKLMQNFLKLQETAIKNHKNELYSKDNSKFCYQFVENANQIKQSIYDLFKMEERLLKHEE